VAPGRKQDPGERFPWADLNRAGLGHWVDPAPVTDGRSLARGDQGDEVESAQALLAQYGYGLSASGVFDGSTEAVVAAFQRHFRPERVDGVADPSTLATLQALIAARPSSRLA
jgi:N-acetylmuramoyl-L-alanine amidase